MTTITSREFNQNASKAQKAAETAPVFITRRGELAHVLMNYAEYQKLTKQSKSAANVLLNLNHPDVADIELDIPPRSKAQRRSVDFEG